ncbi:MAG TPA: AAA family ATPase [Acidimicrobiales bacterium]|nr:AAA family ATPase [Acidimicrobiales bacterium]
MRPQLVLVRGTQGSGKTVLSNRLGLLLGWPVIHREDFRLAVAVTLGAVELEPKGIEARQAVGAFFRELGLFIAQRTSIVADSTFPSGVCEADLAPLLEVSDVGAIHCTLSRELAQERCVRRPNSSTLVDVLRGRDESMWQRFDEPLRCSIPQRRIDTSDGYKPPVEEMASWIAGGFRSET